jgi:hypothetical protein
MMAAMTGPTPKMPVKVVPDAATAARACCGCRAAGRPEANYRHGRPITGVQRATVYHRPEPNQPIPANSPRLVGLERNPVRAGSGLSRQS